MSYTLMSIEPTIACFGTSFSSITEAKNEGIRLQQFGLCEVYSVGKISYDEGYHEVYRSETQDSQRPLQKVHWEEEGF